MAQLPSDSYFAAAPDGKGEPVLVLHAWWGLNDTIKAFCNRLADAGFVVLAPDLYHGKVTDTIEGAQALAHALDGNSDQAMSEILDAVKTLADRTGNSDRGVTLIGFSLGAAYALIASNEDPEHIKSVVVFYGTGADDFSKSQATYLGHFAASDPYEPKEGVEFLKHAVESAGRPITIYTYPDTGHWFFEPDRTDAYNAAAANLAWERTLAFLKRASE